jgi:hypothetical protein
VKAFPIPIVFSAEDPVILLPSIQSHQPMDFLSVGCSWSDLQIQNTTL